MKCLIVSLLLLAAVTASTVKNQSEAQLNFNFKNRARKIQATTSQLQNHKQETNPQEKAKAGKELLEGWVKYIKFDEHNRKDASAGKLTESPLFIRQALTNSIGAASNPANIPGLYFYFLRLYEDKIILSANRANPDQSAREVIDISTILPMAEDSDKGNGIIPLTYNNSRNSVRLNYLDKQITSLKDVPAHNSGVNSIIISSDDKTFFSNLMNQIKKARIEDQRDRNIHVFAKPTNTNSPVDGYWRVTKGKCEKPCGPSVRTIYRMCIPPKNGGKPCIGAPIIKEKCQIKSCDQKTPTSMPINVDIEKKSFSPMKNTLEKCRLAIFDVILLENNQPKPAKVIMDPYVFIATKAGTTDKTAFNMKNTTLTKHSKGLVVSDNVKKVIIAPLGETLDKFKTNWKMMFDLFKEKCRQDPKLSNPPELQKANQEMQKMKMFYMADKKKKARDMQNNRPDGNQSTNAFKKEMQDQRNIQGKLKRIFNDWQNEIKNKKNSALQKRMQKKKDIEDKIRKVQSRQKEKDIVSLLNKENQDIKDLADDVKKSMEEFEKHNKDDIKVKLEGISNTLDNQIGQKNQEIKELSSQLIDLQRSKTGNEGTCREAIKSAETKKTYCQANYNVDQEAINTCLQADNDQFCEMCCSVEFSSSPEDGKKCVTNVCSAQNSQPADPSKPPQGDNSANPKLQFGYTQLS